MSFGMSDERNEIFSPFSENLEASTFDLTALSTFENKEKENPIFEGLSLNLSLAQVQDPVPIFVDGSSSTRCQGAGKVSYTATISGALPITYSLDTASLAAGNTIDAATGEVTYKADWVGASVITAAAVTDNGPRTANHTATTKPTVGTPVFDLGPTSIRCPKEEAVLYMATAANATEISYYLDPLSEASDYLFLHPWGTPYLTYKQNWTGAVTIYAEASGCGGPKVAAHVAMTEDLVANDDFYSLCPGVPYSNRVTYNDSNLSNPTFSIIVMPQHGTLSMDTTGKFVYMPLTMECLEDFFVYEVCNRPSGCCDEATVHLAIGDNVPPVIQNVPADLTVNCDQEIPPAAFVSGFDNCPGISIDMVESIVQDEEEACSNTYNIVRTWTATDLCGNYSAATQTVRVEDLIPPELFRLYTLPNGKKLIGGVAQQMTTAWRHINFPVAFSEAPLVFAQVVTKEDDAAAIVRLRNVSDLGFEMRLSEEESADDIHLPEAVAWIAIEPGLVEDSYQLIAGKITGLTDTIQTVSFDSAFDETPAMIACLQTTKEKDPVTVRFDNVTTTEADVYLQEETSEDAETAHAGETLAYLAFEPNLVLKDKNDDFIGETGFAILTDNWTHVYLQNEYNKPVVILGGATNNDGEPLTLRVRNVTADGFDLRIQEWDYQDDIHGVEKVFYLVMEGNIPFAKENYCTENTLLLQLGYNLFAGDNCENQPVVDYQESSVMEEGRGLVVTRTWSVADGCGNTRVVSRIDTCNIAAVQIRALLGGALIGNQSGNYLMRDDLRTKGLIPLTEPYSGYSDFEQRGDGGSEDIDPGLLSITGENAIVDWVFVEIRDPINEGEVLATQSALVQRKGAVVNTEGEPVLRFPTLSERDYYVAIRHRNHLGMMTDAPHYLSLSNPPVVDFSDLNLLVRGDIKAGKTLETKRTLWPGDLDGNRKVAYQGPENDAFSLFSILLSDPSNTGHLTNYVKTAYDRNDLNMDGALIYQGPGNDRAFLLFYTVLSHPGNTSKLANFIVSEILP